VFEAQSVVSISSTIFPNGNQKSEERWKNKKTTAISETDLKI
jgi:hypothetical protein